MDKASLRKKKMTEGAANKLLVKIEELKLVSVSGVPDKVVHMARVVWAGAVGSCCSPFQTCQLSLVWTPTT